MTGLQVPSLASSSSDKPYLGVTSVPLPQAAPPPAAGLLERTSSMTRERRRRQEEVEVRVGLAGISEKKWWGMVSGCSLI